jgi:hypothetical protein
MNQDYDPFAAYRNYGLAEAEAMDEEEEEDDFSAFSAPAEAAPPRELSGKEVVKDVAKQGAKEFLIGLGGTYGDLLELAGPNEQPEAEREKNSREFQTLKKMEEPGYKPSFLDIFSLSGDDDVAPPNRLPTSESLRDINYMFGGPGEAESEAGRYAGRIGKLAGAGAAFGQFNPTSAITGGIVGQAAEESGASPLTQAAAEIVTMLLTPGGGAATLSSATRKEVRDQINDLRRLGYSDHDITLALNSASKGKKFGVRASRGEKTDEAFQAARSKSDQLVSDILVSEIPGIQGGTKNVHQLASDVYGEVAKEASKIKLKDTKPFLDSVEGVMNDLSKNLGTGEEAKAFIRRLKTAAKSAKKNPNAEQFMEFYKELNRMGSWMGRSQKDRLLNQVKDGIKETFRAEGKTGSRLAKRFEEANTGVRKAYQAEEVHDLIQKTMTQDGINYNQLYKVFDKPDNVHLMEEVLGPQQTRNLNQIARTGRDISNFDRSFKGASLLGGTLPSSIAQISYMAYSQNWAGLAAIKGIGALGRKLAERSLTDPKFQNILIRGIHAVAKESPRLFRSANDSLEKYLEEEFSDYRNIKKKEAQQAK